MNNIVIIARSNVAETDLKSARLGTRFGRLDLSSRLALLAVESFAAQFEKFSRDRIAICLAASAGSLSTDVEYWQGRDATGGPSPTLFAYTLPSAAIGEIAIRHRLTGLNLCFVGYEKLLLPEATDLIQRGEADGCLCVYCEVVNATAAKMINASTAARAGAFFLARES